MKTLIKFAKNESGATAIEYGLIAAGISVAIIAVVQGLGSKLNTTFTSVQTALKQAQRLRLNAKGSGFRPGPFCFCRGANCSTQEALAPSIQPLRAKKANKIV